MGLTITKCKCGRRMAKGANKCLRCHNKRMAECYAEARKVVLTGRCPLCGDNLERNLALSGWFQCANYGTRKLDNGRADNQNCDYQTFTGEDYRT